MTKYLIDVNLPYHFVNWHGNDYMHLKDIDSRMPDKEIWEYARINGLTIVTKDVDFADRIVIHTPPPKVIHFKIGNLKMNLFHDFITKHWQNIIKLNEQYKLVNVYIDRIEGID